MDILNLIHNYLSANGNRDALKAVIESFLNAVMEAESKQQCGSEYYERNDLISRFSDSSIHLNSAF